MWQRIGAEVQMGKGQVLGVREGAAPHPCVGRLGCPVLNAPWESCHRARAEHTAETKPEGKSPQAAPVGDSLAVS